jgi:putative transcriptional regulator
MRISKKRKARNYAYLDGQLLVAMPIMTDRRFARSVIYMCAHSAEGAMGLIINQRASHISFSELMKQLSIMPETADEVEIELEDMDVHVGGPVETQRGFVLHSAD